MKTTSTFAIAAVIAALPATAAAQQPESDRVELRFAPGLVQQYGVFGDDDPRGTSAIGPTLGFQLRRHPAHRTGFSFEATLQPTGIDNPHFDETLRSIYVQAGAEIGRRMYVRPSAGVAFQFWSGAFAADPSIALAFGVAIGYRRPPGERASFWPELVARVSGGPGIGHAMVGVQVPIAGRAR
jgi:hypothetical protein